MSLGKVHAITDVCILVEDVERTVRFYTEKLGFVLRRRAEGFADFAGAGITLAAWEIDHIHTHTGVSGRRAPHGTHKACIAVELETREALDTLYEELRGRACRFRRRPRHIRGMPAASTSAIRMTRFGNCTSGGRGPR